MELVPKETAEPENLYDKYDAGFYAQLSDQAQTGRRYNRLPKKAERKTRILDALTEVFELCGGVPRLAMWADANYGQYIKAVGRTLPTIASQIQVNASGPVQIISAIPATALDGEEYVEVNCTPEQVEARVGGSSG